MTTVQYWWYFEDKKQKDTNTMALLLIRKYFDNSIQLFVSSTKFANVQAMKIFQIDYVFLWCWFNSTLIKQSF